VLFIGGVEEKFGGLGDQHALFFPLGEIVSRTDW